MNSKIRKFATTLGLVLGTIQAGSAAADGGDPYVGEILWVPYNFAPKNWAFCDGQLLPIAQNPALFSLLGTLYGGDGITSFALPNMQGRVLIHDGQGAGLSYYQQGDMGGTTSVTLTQNEMPAHSHPVVASTSLADQTEASGHVFAMAGQGNLYGAQAGATLSPSALLPAGAGQPHANMMPFTTLNCIISLQGIYPQRP